MQQKNEKNEHIKSVIFQTHSNKSYSKKVSVLFIIKFRRKFIILGFIKYS
jgi:hypothetical protein